MSDSRWNEHTRWKDKVVVDWQGIRCSVAIIFPPSCETNLIIIYIFLWWEKSAIAIVVIFSNHDHVRFSRFYGRTVGGSRYRLRTYSRARKLRRHIKKPSCACIPISYNKGELHSHTSTLRRRSLLLFRWAEHESSSNNLFLLVKLGNILKINI